MPAWLFNAHVEASRVEEATAFFTIRDAVGCTSMGGFKDRDREAVVKQRHDVLRQSLRALDDAKPTERWADTPAERQKRWFG